MAQDIIAEQLADGQLALAEGDLYLCPASTRAFVKSIVCSNVLGANTGMKLFLKPGGGTSRRIVHLDTMTDGDVLYFNEPTTLDAGDAIRGIADDANAVDYVISGAEQST